MDKFYTLLLVLLIVIPLLVINVCLYVTWLTEGKRSWIFGGIPAIIFIEVPVFGLALLLWAIRAMRIALIEEFRHRF